MQARSPLRQLQLDAAVAAEGLLGLRPDRSAGIRRSRRPPAAAARRPCRSDTARPRSRAPPTAPSSIGNCGAADRPHVGVAVDAQHPGDLARDLPLELEQRGGELVELGAALGLRARPGRCRRTLPTGTRSGRRRCGCRAGCRGSRAAGRRSRSGSATVPARAGPARRSAAGRDRRCALCDSLSRFSEASSASSSARELAAQRRDLLVEHLDLRQRARGQLLLGIELAVELGGLALRVGGAAADAFVEALEAVALAFGRRRGSRAAARAAPRG